MMMNARWVRRDFLLLRSLSCPRIQLHHPPSFRCIATVQSTPTAFAAADTSPPSPFGSLLEDGVNDKRAATAGSATSGAGSSLPLSEIFAEETRDELDERFVPPRATQGQQTEQHTSHSPCVYIVPESRVLSFPGILALIRELERRFGRVRDFKILRDKDSLDTYIKTLFVIFRDQESAKRLEHVLQGKQSGRIMVPAPTRWDTTKDLNGGVGLEDIQPFLRPVDSEATEVVTASDQDKQMGNVISHAEELESSGAPVAETDANVSKEGIPPNSVDLCEVRIEVLSDGFAIEPMPRDMLKTWQSRERKINMTRAFARWGGFYPHYRFSPYTDEEGQIVLGGRVVDNVEDLTEGQRQQAETIRLATNSMRDALVRARSRLKSNGEPDHGLAERDGRQVVLDWEVEKTLGSIEDTTAVADVDGTPVEDTEGSTSRVGGVSTPFEPNVSAAEIEETRNALQPPASDDSQLETKATSPPENAETTSQRSPTLFSKHTPALQKPKSSEEVLQATPQQGLSSTTKSTNDLPEGAHTAPAEIVNNRTRRARKKAEQERAGFKAKLLGWLGR